MYNDVDPTKLFNLFNYGELIHFGKRSEDYDKMAEDASSVTFRDDCDYRCGLCHLTSAAAPGVTTMSQPIENSPDKRHGRPHTAMDLFGPTPQVRANIVR
jgi:hypothetical protein